MFADDITVYLAGGDDFGVIQTILNSWRAVSGQSLTKGKHKSSLWGREYRQTVVETRRLNEDAQGFPEGARITRDGEPVRILNAWVGNGVSEVRFSNGKGLTESREMGPETSYH